MFYSDRLQLWNNFNICWLAVCQKQKDMTLELLGAGHQPSNTSMLSSDRLDDMGRKLIQLCDQMEQHGLVDYQMGIWEEEILCGKHPTFSRETLSRNLAPLSDSATHRLVLGECIDLIESRPSNMRTHGVNAAAAATSRS